MGHCQSRNSTSVMQSKMNETTILFVLGGPGSGKGTQCEKISEKYKFTHISTGDLFREEIKNDTDRAKKVKEMMSQGALIPNEITMDILADALNNMDATRFLLDGFPRELGQVEAFNKKFGRGCNFALYFEVPAEVMKERCLKRGETSGRSDDNAESIIKRLDTYFEKSKPVIDKFEEDKVLKKINANQAIDDVWAEVQGVFSDIIKDM
eukprot:m.4147 g.4147  ORF g.4147 m.4147 type:complete len:209 (-) comp3826_c0_seq1:217-843(-)